jgi:hypothetical protein|uniref:Uncharacterized protein n=1 Tax=Zea mays TaxID=4577 RepID=C4J6S8_MAIZE|nr:unknown [Zea mays]
MPASPPWWHRRGAAGRRGLGQKSGLLASPAAGAATARGLFTAAAAKWLMLSRVIFCFFFSLVSRLDLESLYTNPAGTKGRRKNWLGASVERAGRRVKLRCFFSSCADLSLERTKQEEGQKNDESSDRFVRESMLFRHETSVGEICGHWPCQKKPNLSARHRHRHVNRYDEPVQEQGQI